MAQTALPTSEFHLHSSHSSNSTSPSLSFSSLYLAQALPSRFDPLYTGRSHSTILSYPSSLILCHQTATTFLVIMKLKFYDETPFTASAGRWVCTSCRPVQPISVTSLNGGPTHQCCSKPRSSPSIFSFWVLVL